MLHARRAMSLRRGGTEFAASEMTGGVDVGRSFQVMTADPAVNSGTLCPVRCHRVESYRLSRSVAADANG